MKYDQVGCFKDEPNWQAPPIVERLLRKLLILLETIRPQGYFVVSLL